MIDTWRLRNAGIGEVCIGKSLDQAGHKIEHNTIGWTETVSATNLSPQRLPFRHSRHVIPKAKRNGLSMLFRRVVARQKTPES